MYVYSGGLSQYTVEQRELCSCWVPAVKLSSGPHCRASSHHIDHLLQDVAGATCTAFHCASKWLLCLSGKKKKTQEEQWQYFNNSTTIATTMSSTSSTCIKKYFLWNCTPANVAYPMIIALCFSLFYLYFLLYLSSLCFLTYLYHICIRVY